MPARPDQQQTIKTVSAGKVSDAHRLCRQQTQRSELRVLSLAILTHSVYVCQTVPPTDCMHVKSCIIGQDRRDQTVGTASAVYIDCLSIARAAIAAQSV